jgi:ABC-2 type transport system ATP-binding protein
MLDQVTKICTRIGIMNQGRLMITDSLEGIMSRFADDRSLEDIYLHFWHNGAATDIAEKVAL